MIGNLVKVLRAMVDTKTCVRHRRFRPSREFRPAKWSIDLTLKNSII